MHYGVKLYAYDTLLLMVLMDLDKVGLLSEPQKPWPKITKLACGWL